MDKVKTIVKNTKMKTLKTTFAIALTTTLMFAGSLMALEFNFEDEIYVNDIPFNTEEISLMVTSGSTTFDFEEEAYINDIPLYIECVTADCLYEKALAEDYLFEDESFVEDIPFDTETVSTKSNYTNASTISFDFEDEDYVNDIPFDTYAISKYNCNLYLQALNK